MLLSLSSSSSSGSETKGIFNEETVKLPSFIPYEEDLEPLATAKETAKQEARMAEELDEERAFRKDSLVKWMLVHGTRSELFFSIIVCQHLHYTNFHSSPQIMPYL